MGMVFKRESYLKDAVNFVVLSVVIYVLNSVSSPYYKGFTLIFAALWLLTLIGFLLGYTKRIILSDEGIAVKTLTGGWSCAWSEIDEWNSTVDVEGSREIIITTGGRSHILPTEVTDNYRGYIKEILAEHCGEAAKANGWMAFNDTR